MRKFAFLSVSAILALCPIGQAAPTASAPSPTEAPRPVAVKPFALGAPNLVLLVSGGDNGMLEVCDCPGPDSMPGGLSRKSGLAISYRAAFPNAVFLLDAGNGFLRGGDSLINDFHMYGFRQIGYDAVVMGEYEWAVSSGRLATLTSQVKLEYLSTTVREIKAPEGRDLLPIVRVVKRTFGPGKIAILSDLRAEWKPMIPNVRQAELAFAPPAELTALSDQLHKDGYVVFVVCHGDEEVLKQTAAACPRADVFIRGLRTKSADKLLTIADGRPLLTVWGHESVGALAVQFTPEGRIGKMEYRRESVSSKWPVDGRVLQTYRDYCKVAMIAALDPGKRKPGPKFFPSLSCGTCHKAQYENWKASKHAKAYKTLVREKRTDDPACMSCHTTGFGTTKGFITIEKTPNLAGVNCQDCHVMDAAEHLKIPKAYPKPVTEETCRVCHTQVTDPKFDLSKRLSEYHCPKGKPPLPAGASPRQVSQPAK